MQLGSLPLTLRQLQYVVAVADARSFRRAAEHCRVSQPSLSAQVAELESALGVRLFERDRRGVLLTPAGEALVQRARRVLLEAEDLVQDARRHTDPLAGTLRIGVIPTLAPYLLPEVDPALRRSFGQLQLLWIEEKTEVLVEAIVRGELDAALLALEANLGELDYETIGRDRFLFAAAKEHSLAKGGAPLPLERLKGEHVLLLDEGHCFREQALALCAKAGADEIGFRATSLSTLAQMAAAGSGVTLLPEVAVELENRRGLLAVRPFCEPVPHRTIVLAFRRRSSMREALAAVAACARNAYAALLAQRRIPEANGGRARGSRSSRKQGRTRSHSAERSSRKSHAARD